MRMNDDNQINERYTPSKRHRIQMNRLFRERVGSSFLPFPEVDNLYERIRSKIVIKLKINEFLDRFQKKETGMISNSQKGDSL